MPVVSVQQLVSLVLCGASLQSFRVPAAAHVTCHCDCDCSTAARVEGVALLALGLLLGGFSSRIWGAFRQALWRAVGRRASLRAALSATAGDDAPPPRRLALSARPLQH